MKNLILSTIIMFSMVAVFTTNVKASTLTGKSLTQLQDIQTCQTEVELQYINPVTDELYVEDGDISQDVYQDMLDECILSY